MTASKSVPVMKTIAETAQHFNLPEHFCRRAVLDGKVVFVRAGSKYLINVERFADWLNTGEKAAPPEPEQPHGRIRPQY